MRRRNRLAGRVTDAASRTAPGSGLAGAGARVRQLDSIDLAILAELQADCTITNVELARRVGVSPPPVLRRVRTLEEEGIVRGYRALVNAAALGFPITCFAFVQLASQARADLVAFADRVRNWPLVRQCWTLSGENDFLLQCVAADAGSIPGLVEELTAWPNVRNVRTSLALEHVKDEAAVPLATLPKPR